MPKKLSGKIRGQCAKNELDNWANTRNNKVNAIASYYNFLECYEYIVEDNPTRLIRRARTRRRLPVYLTVEEAAALLEAAASGANPGRDTAIFRVMIQTGLRAGEMVRLRVQDLDLNSTRYWSRVKVISSGWCLSPIILAWHWKHTYLCARPPVPMWMHF